MTGANDGPAEGAEVLGDFEGLVVGATVGTSLGGKVVWQRPVISLVRKTFRYHST